MLSPRTTASNTLVDTTVCLVLLNDCHGRFKSAAWRTTTMNQCASQSLRLHQRDRMMAAYRNLDLFFLRSQHRRSNSIAPNSIRNVVVVRTPTQESNRYEPVCFGKIDKSQNKCISGVTLLLVKILALKCTSYSSYTLAPTSTSTGKNCPDSWKK